MSRPSRAARYAASAQARSAPAPAAWTPARALRQECLFVGAIASLLSLLSLAYCLPHQLVLLYGDAVAHLHIARRIFDSINPGFRQLGSVWLPLPHLLLLPFVQKMSWWQSGFAGAPPSMLAYVFGVVGLYRLARYWLQPAAAAVGAAFYALNPGLLYMQTTAMNEPLFLAEMIWAAVSLTALARATAHLVTVEAVYAEQQHATAVAAHAASQRFELAGEERRLERLLVLLGLLLAAAVFTRYDGWIFAALAWCLACWTTMRHRRLRRHSGGIFVLFTAIVLTAPLGWLAYNQKQFHDPLDFLRGPYSARAIDLKTTPPGASHYPGWHHYGIAAHYFVKTAELGATPAHAGNVLLLLAFAGVAVALVRRQARGVLALLWLPWPFYAYSVAYGSVPIFIPPWPPYSFYNTRYGMELLPALALSLAFALHAALQWVRRRGPLWAPLAANVTAVVLVLLNTWALVRATPLVFAEAVVNSRTRIPFESALGRALASLPPGEILMYTSDHIGAVEQAGLSLRRTINDTDDQAWSAALAHPATAAPFVVAIEGDAVAHAIAAHPGGLSLLDVVCSTGQPCARIYASDRLPQSFYITPSGPGSLSNK